MELKVNNDLHLQYLHHMGIEVWEYRDKHSPNAENICHQYQLFNHQHQIIGILLADAQNNNQRRLIEQRLIKSICFALNIHTEQCEIIHFLKTDIHLTPELQFVILLGEHITQYLLKTKKSLTELRQTTHSLNNITVLISHAPIHLLSQPSLKAQAWNDLQKILQIEN